MEARGREPARYTTPVGVILTQVFHHANEHRAHICTILGALGYDVPDVSAWGYGFASGRSAGIKACGRRCVVRRRTTQRAGNSVRR